MVAPIHLNLFLLRVIVDSGLHLFISLSLSDCPLRPTHVTPRQLLYLYDAGLFARSHHSSLSLFTFPSLHPSTLFTTCPVIINHRLPLQLEQGPVYGLPDDVDIHNDYISIQIRLHLGTLFERIGFSMSTRSVWSV